MFRLIASPHSARQLEGMDVSGSISILRAEGVEVLERSNRAGAAFQASPELRAKPGGFDRRAAPAFHLRSAGYRLAYSTDARI
jgi:hypothetical protein